MTVTDLLTERNRRFNINGLADVCPGSKNKRGPNALKAIGAKPTHKVSPYEARASLQQAKHDASTMTGAKLRAHYPGTFQCWKNMRYDRPRSEGAVIADGFTTFKDFLALMGPRHHPDYTIDRTNPHDPEYAPGKCRWADKRQQANNRRNTQLLPHPETGEPTPLTEVARIQGVSPSTLRKSVNRGSKEALTRPAYIEPDVDPRKRWPWPLEPDRFKLWDQAFKAERRVTEEGIEWPMEYSLRKIRQLLRDDRARMEAIGSGYDDLEVSAPADVRQEFQVARERVHRRAQQLREVEAAFPAWRLEVRCFPRKQPPRNFWHNER